MTSYEKDLSEITRRESHLWSIAMILLIILVVVMVGVFYALFARSGLLDTESRSMVLRAVAGVLALTVVFCFYAFHARTSFAKIRGLFEAQALRDTLTGLYNRQSFPERIRLELERAKRNGSILGILLCDLDDFKNINDQYGHPVGDDALRRVSEAVLRATRGTDLVFRWGGDEILVVLSATERNGAVTAGHRIRDRVEEVRKSMGAPVDVSIGIAIFPEHGLEIEELIQLADKALYIAKRSGSKVHIGEEELPLGDEAVKLVFQPVVNSKTQETMGYEVLSRDPDGSLSILDLFRRYEAVGQLAELKQRIFLQQLRAVSELGIKRAFINVDFDLLQSISPTTKPEGAEVILEISEAETVRNIDDYLEVVEAWRAKGYQFAIDDFGSNFLSLPFLIKLLPSFIKMDRSAFVQAAESERFGDFLRDMIAAMRNYSRDGIIAEGVETEADLEVVTRLGVRQVQGHLTGRPTEYAQAVEKEDVAAVSR